MQDGASHTAVVVENNEAQAPVGSPPPPPDPNVHDEAAAVPINPSTSPKSNEPLRVDSESWDIFSITDRAALQMLVEALEGLSKNTGDVPPTPPVSRPSTPGPFGRLRPGHQRKASSTIPRVSSSQDVPSLEIGSPEAHPHEPITVVVGTGVEDVSFQHQAIARRFFSKTAPPFTLGQYLKRFHQYCPHSPGVYLGAAAYIHQLCVADLVVPATERTIHRLALAAIRVAAKSLEDNKWSQERVAKMGGISNNQMMNLEIAMCFLLDFELYLDEKIMARRMFLLQQAARRGFGAQGGLSEQFKLRLPMRKKNPK
ncbi:Putative cyclin PHO80, Cyclin-like superfamily [Septoria linicola]|uniref:Cyclin PHO80, Cyclin-like superfamily n=1 Tax=Septoria linicola TaxID=215465 RepID=A0A9Q9AWM7_9PEZI|nr:putative cyclin PHO80, Cyclin-like superfamily [Septoria linicola]USW54533.1 Putative cyclin PHO80, Cyclin-like superfamily [Septoria linicola]